MEIFLWHQWCLPGLFEIEQTIGPFTLAKTKIPQTWVFCCTVYTARKTHNLLVFGQEKRMREKTLNLILFFGYVMRMRDFSLPLTIRSAQYVAGRGWFRGRSHPTWPKTRIIPVRGERGVYIGKKTVKNRRSFIKPHFGGGFFDLGFIAVFRGSCLATSLRKTGMWEKLRFFFMPV